MIPTTTKEWVFVTAQTDFQIQVVGAAERMTAVYGQATCSNSNTGDVSLRVGFAAATLPTISNDSATGGLGVFMSHPGIAKGGGMVVSNGGAPIAVGAMGEDLRITCAAATGGAIRIVITYWIDDLTAPT
jgi:hypothetical protein